MRAATPVTVHAANTGTVTRGTVTLATLPLAARARRAAPLALGGILLAVVLLPVPLMHFGGIAAGVVLLVLAGRKLAAATVVTAAEGRCPGCGVEGRFFVGFGERPWRPPVATACSGCQVGLRLEPA